MLKECQTHGYFRAEKCPVCNDEARFLMSDEEIDKLGRIMAGILRHFPERFDLDMDDHGWVNVYDMVNAIKRKRNQFHWLRPHHLVAIVDTDPKGRYQIDDKYIRATYAHSINVILDLPTDNIPERLYYPATEEEADMILENGLRPTDRKCVHLSLTKEDALVASAHRDANPIILEVDSKKAIEAGNVIKRAGKTVFVTNEVPAPFLSKLQ